MKIFLAGHNGMVGRSILSKLSSHNDKIVVCRARDELDLLDEVSVKKFFKNEKFDGVIIASAKVGGILQIIHTPLILFMRIFKFKIIL